MQITCDRCDQPFEVEHGQPGQKVECPACGDVNVIPGAIAKGVPVGTSTGNGNGRKDRAAEAGYPPAHGPETNVISVRPAMLGAHPIRFLLLFLLLLGGIGGAIAFALILTPVNIPIAIGCGVVAALALIALVVWKVHTLSEGLTITTKRTIDSQGLLSKRTSEVLHADIRNIVVQQSFLDRVWNVGTLALSSSADDQVEVQMKDVPNPQKLKQIIDLYRPL